MASCYANEARRRVARRAVSTKQLSLTVQRRLEVVAERGAVDIIVEQVAFQGVMARHLMVFAAFFAEPNAQAPFLTEHGADVDADGRGDASKRVNH